MVLEVEPKELYCSSITDPHPWTPERHLAQVLFTKMKQDYPNADMEYLFNGSLKLCLDAWTTSMTNVQKRKYILLSEEDKLKTQQQQHKSGIKTPGKTKNQSESVTKQNPKDKNKPKKPMGPFFVFLNEKRNSIRNEFPDLANKDVSKKASELYNKLSAKKKEAYEKEFAKQMAKYKEELLAYGK